MADLVLDGLAVGVLLQQAQAVGDHADDLVVGVGLAQRLDAAVLQIDQVEGGGLTVVADVVFLILGVDGQHDVGEQAVVLHTGVLDQEELDGGVAEGLDGAVGVVPAGGQAGGVGPHHVDGRAALGGIGVLDELLAGRGDLQGGAVDLEVALQDGVVHQGLGDALLGRPCQGKGL